MTQEQVDHACTSIPVDSLSAAYGAPLTYRQVQLTPHMATSGLACTYETADKIHRVSFGRLTEQTATFVRDNLGKTTGMAVKDLPEFGNGAYGAKRPDDAEGSLGAVTFNDGRDWFMLQFTHIQIIQQAGGQEFATYEGDLQHDLAVAKVISNASPHVQN